MSDKASRRGVSATKGAQRISHPTRYTRPIHELWDALERQMAALRASAAAFDKGEDWEAMRLATAVHTLVHDGGRNTVALLTQLHLKQTLQFRAGAPINERSLTTQMPLVYMRASNTGAVYQPFLDQGPPMPERYLPFTKWWEEPVLRDDKSRLLTRKNLVRSMRDQDGGAHIDGGLDDEAYVAISRHNGAAMEFCADGHPPRPLNPGPERATMRHIAWELEQTLKSVSRPANAHGP